MSLKIIILNTSSQTDGSFSVSGVFWLTAPSTNIVPLPNFKSQVQLIDSVSLLDLQYGNIVEEPFESGLFASGTNLSQVQTALQSQFNNSQTILNNSSSPLNGLVGNVYDGYTWSTSNPFTLVSSINIAPQYTRRYYNWTNFKIIYAIKGGTYQYDDNGSIYTIWFYDGPEVYICNIWKGTLPSTQIQSGYSQSQNNSDKSDFETNFKPFANKNINAKSNITLGYTTSSGSTLTAIRATAYIEQTTNAQRSIASSSTSDTSAGIGAKTVTITYYDQTLLGPFTETLSLNGTSFVNTVNSNICFIEKVEVSTVGNQLSNVGNLTLKAASAGGGATIGTIPAGDGITNWCHHYVGINKIMSLVSVIGTIKGISNGAIEVHKTIPTNSNKPELTIAPKIRMLSGSSDRLTFDVPIMIPGPALVLVYGRSDSSSGTLDWSVGMGYYEV